MCYAVRAINRRSCLCLQGGSAMRWDDDDYDDADNDRRMKVYKSLLVSSTSTLSWDLCCNIAAWW